MEDDYKEKVLKFRERFRRFVAVCLAAIVYLGGYILFTGIFGGRTEGEDHSYWPLIVAALTILGWWAAQSDNREAEATGDKTLIVSTWWRDLTVVTFSLGAAAVLCDFIGFLHWAVVFGAGIAALSGWLVGRHLWKRAPAI